MKPRRPLDDALVGLFVVAALVVLVIGTLWLAGQPLFGGTRVTYLVVMKDGGGLRAGDEVRSAGVPVGRTTTLKLRPGNDWPVLLQVSLDSGITMGRWGWGSIFSDINNDGRLDMVVPNGFLTSTGSKDL